MFGWISKAAKSIGKGASWVGKKASSAASSVASVAKKAVSAGHSAAHSIASVGKKVGDISGDIATGASVVAGGAAMLGLEPVAGVALGVAGAAKTIQGGAALTSEVAGDVDRGLNRATAIGASAEQILKAAMRGNIKGAVGSGVALTRAVQSDIGKAQKYTRSTIERGKDLRAQIKR